MANLHNDVYDNGLSVLAQAEKLVILSADPGLDYSAIAGTLLATKSNPGVSAPQNKDGGGRQVTIPALTGGAVTATGDGTHYALTDDSASKILASAAIENPQRFTENNTFSTPEMTLGIPAAA